MNQSARQHTTLSRLQAKWGVSSIGQVLLILVVFTLAGSTAVFLRKQFFQLIGFGDHTAFWLKAVAYVLFLFPAYQVLLLLYGTLLGQFSFFWAKEKKMMGTISRLWTR